MTILICSPGRSGSAWLCSLLAGCNLRVAHEWSGTPYTPDVVADTSWLWNQDEFLKSLNVEDVVIVLDRDVAQRSASIEKLLGKRDYSALEHQWQTFKQKLLMLDDVVSLDYSELFTSIGKEKLFKLLWYKTGSATGNFENMWDLIRHMNITNDTCQRAVKESYGGA